MSLARTSCEVMVIAAPLSPNWPLLATLPDAGGKSSRGIAPAVATEWREGHAQTIGNRRVIERSPKYLIPENITHTQSFTVEFASAV